MSEKNEETDYGELVYAGCASWSLCGRKDKGKDFDGVEERNLWGFHRLKPLVGVKIKTVISGCVSATCVAIGINGECYTWGRNQHGQLGTGSLCNQYNPTLVDIPNKESVIGGACGPNHTLLITATGGLLASGNGRSGQLGTGRKQDVKNFVQVGFPAVATSVGCGRDFSMVVDSNGVMYSFGHPEFGCLGNNTEGKTLEKANKFSFESQTTPMPIVAFAKTYGDVKIQQISCGAKHSCAVDTEGRIYTWGYGAYGRLGHGDNKNQMVPMAVELFSYEPPPLRPDIPSFLQHSQPRLRAAFVTCGHSCTYIVTKEPYGVLYMFGVTKRTAEATMYPALVDQVSGWKVHSVSSGNSSTAVAAELSLITWGPSPTFGELGYGSDAGIKSSMHSRKVESLTDCPIKEVASGLCHTLAIVKPSNLSTTCLEKLPVFAPDEVIATGTPQSTNEVNSRKAKRTKPSHDEEESDEETSDESSDDDQSSDDEDYRKPKSKRAPARKAPKRKANALKSTKNSNRNKRR